MKKFEIIKQLDELGIKATRVRGQNFLIDEKVVSDMLEAGEVGNHDSIVEIGPGLGVLTRQLADKAGCVVAVELDPALAKHIRAVFSSKKFNLIEGDILHFSTSDIVKYCKSGAYKVIANIPYNITGKIIEKFIQEEPAPQLITLLVQREVAERIAANPPNMSRLAVFVQYFGHPEIIRTVSKELFFPKPKVESMILRVRRNPRSVLASREKSFKREDFFRLVQAGFSSPRRKLVGNLSRGLGYSSGVIEGIFKKIKIDSNIRAERLDVNGWIDLAKEIFKVVFEKEKPPENN